MVLTPIVVRIEIRTLDEQLMLGAPEELPTHRDTSEVYHAPLTSTSATCS